MWKLGSKAIGPGGRLARNVGGGGAGGRTNSPPARSPAPIARRAGSYPNSE
jgi:hypothetical protein